MTPRIYWRRLRMGLETLFGIRRQGFFIPYRYADGIAPAQPLYAEVAALMQGREAAFREVLAGIAEHAADFASFKGSPRFEQDWFPTLDATAAYTLVRRWQPQRIVEVGSGHSTRFMARAVSDGALSTRITAIDPAPRASLKGLAVDFRPGIAQSADPAIFDALQANDLLFIDSSHILMPGSDVDWLFNRVLPRLPVGCHVHIHDIFLPDDYPADWLWRGYNEQQALPLLLAGGGWRLDFASHYAATRLTAEVDQALGPLPRAAGAYPASIWLTRL
ncbi:class I SAM-dependent methyltransferase [Ferrovibrio sp.]|uniref:class I SAM-dependent methyltransferase n=1 Tax=Ferrovibrio sp. TaxID=1917215 RepID=UPI003D2D2686